MDTDRTRRGQGHGRGAHVEAGRREGGKDTQLHGRATWGEGGVKIYARPRRTGPRARATAAATRGEG
eukprot:3365702-Prymnesium_polylepis.1